MASAAGDDGSNMTASAAGPAASSTPSASRASRSRIRGPKVDIAASAVDDTTLSAAGQTATSAPVTNGDGIPALATSRSEEPKSTVKAHRPKVPPINLAAAPSVDAAGLLNAAVPDSSTVPTVVVREASDEPVPSADATSRDARESVDGSSSAPAVDESAVAASGSSLAETDLLKKSRKNKAKKNKKDKQDKKDRKSNKKKKGTSVAGVGDTSGLDPAGPVTIDDTAPTVAVTGADNPPAGRSGTEEPSAADAAIAAAKAAAAKAADAPQPTFKGRVQRTVAPDAHGSLTGVFMVTFSGQIVSAEFPFQDSLWCKYKFRYGKDWHPVSGTQEGMSQATRRSTDGRHVCVWNFPVEITFKSTNPFGWPQIVVVVSGIDSLGRDVVRGYGSQHLPTIPGVYTRVVPTFVPVPSSTLERLTGYLIGTRAEFVEDKFVAGGIGREVTRVKSQGSVKLSLSVATKDMGRYGFRVGGAPQH